MKNITIIILITIILLNNIIYSQSTKISANSYISYNISSIQYLNVNIETPYEMYTTAMTSNEFNQFQIQNNIYIEFPYNNSIQFTGTFLQAILKNQNYDYLVIMNKGTQNVEINFVISEYNENSNYPENTNNKDEVLIVSFSLLFLGVVVVFTFFTLFGSLFSCFALKK